MAADLLLGDFSRRQLLPAEQQRVGHLTEWVQVYEPNSALQQHLRVQVSVQVDF